MPGNPIHPELPGDGFNRRSSETLAYDGNLPFDVHIELQ
jgi:hypothetical protein